MTIDQKLEIPQRNYTYDDIDCAVREVGFEDGNLTKIINLFYPKEFPKEGVNEKRMKSIIEAVAYLEERKLNPIYEIAQKRIVEEKYQRNLEHLTKVKRGFSNFVRAFVGNSLEIISIPLIIPSKLRRMTCEEPNRLELESFCPVNINTGEKEGFKKFSSYMNGTFCPNIPYALGTGLSYLIATPITFMISVASFCPPFLGIAQIVLGTTNVTSAIYENVRKKKEKFYQKLGNY